MSWAWKPERASDCMNGRYKCQNFWCSRTLKKAGFCLKCRKEQKEKAKGETTS